MIEIVRLSTVHPALVHFTIGTLPLIVTAYAVAARRRSERWTFAGDAALAITAAITVATAAFGLVSNAVVPWPGGLALWRWLHLGFGAASAAALLVFATVRWWRRQTSPTSGGGTFVAALVVTLLVGFTGWIGGEVLVFRSGMAVRAAGDGALAPPAMPARTPRDLVDAMGRLRAAWASAESALSSMIVQEPRAQTFAAIERDARQMSELAEWMAKEGARSMPNAGAPSEHHGDEAEHEHGEDEHEHEHEHGELTVGAHLALMARELGGHTTALAGAAHARDIAATAHALGDIQSACASCHAELRWEEAPAPQAAR
jgi:uncharacterized membrane protein